MCVLVYIYVQCVFVCIYIYTYSFIIKKRIKKTCGAHKSTLLFLFSPSFCLYLPIIFSSLYLSQQNSPSPLSSSSFSPFPLQDFLLTLELISSTIFFWGKKKSWRTLQGLQGGGLQINFGEDWRFQGFSQNPFGRNFYLVSNS